MITEGKIRLKIVTPRGVKVDQEADKVVFRCLSGDMGVRPRHAPMTVVMGDGILQVMDGDSEQRIAVFGGVALVEDNTVKILTSIAQRPGEIDVARAERDRREIEFILQDQERADDVEVQSHQVLLRRALVRIEVSLQPEDDDE